MLYADVNQDPDVLAFTVADFELIVPADYDFQSSYHISLKDETKGRIIKRAWDSKRAIVEVHSHVGEFSTAAFSPSDHKGFADYVPHVMWRLRGQPYAAIVVADGAFDGLVWTSTGALPQQLNSICLGSVRLQPTAATHSTRGAR